MSVSVFNDTLLGGLFGNKIVEDAFSTTATLQSYMKFEIALTKALARSGFLDGDAEASILTACQTFVPDTDLLKEDTARDGLAVPGYVRQLRKHIGEPHAKSLHFGATSQDLIDTALVFALKKVNAEFSLNIRMLLEQFEQLNQSFGDAVLMGRTRMQAALPVKISDRIANWTAPLARHAERLDLLSPALSVLQFGGAVGTRHAFGDKGRAVGATIALELGLSNPTKAWHTERDTLVEYAGWLSLLSGSLGKFGQDVCLMAQQGIDEISFSGSGASSAMPHKQNPILAETLVTLAKFNAVQVSATHQALVHEQERSGAAWALEWMVLPQMCAATGAGLRSAIKLVESVRRMGSPSN